MTAQLNIISENTIHIFDLATEKILRDAEDRYLNNDFQAALDNIEKVLKSNPDNNKALLLKGDILFSNGYKTEALKSYQKTIEVDSTCAKAYSSISAILDMFGNTLEAYNYCLKAFEYINKNDYEFLTSLYDQKISILMAMKNYREIRKTLKEASKDLTREDSEYIKSCFQNTHPKTTIQRCL